MLAAFAEDEAVKITGFSGIEVYKIRSTKFKTNSIHFFFIDMLSKENAAKNALIPAVLGRGSRNLPTHRDIALYLESLYETSFYYYVYKKGVNQIIQFSIEFLNEKYVGVNVCQKSLELLFEIIQEPILQNGVFKEEYLFQEKQNLQKLIRSRLNDKRMYSLERCLEEMCSNEPFGIYQYGTIEDIDKIDAATLYKYYSEMQAANPVKVYLSGDFSDDMVKMVISRLRTFERNAIKQIKPVGFNFRGKGIRSVTEKMCINQSKLCLGLRTDIKSLEEDYYPLLVCNSILGGGIHSKLFRSIRENAGLAYSVYSKLDIYTGLMVMGSGIETGNKDIVLGLMCEQLNEIKKGVISEYEFENALKKIEVEMKLLKDNHFQIVDFFLSQSILGIDGCIDNTLEKLNKVKMEEVIRVSKGISLDTIYFLSV